jgi:hypothetical protein
LQHLASLDALPKDYARGAAPCIVADDRYAIRIRFAEELHAEAFMKGDRAQIGGRGYRLDMPAAMPLGELDEVTEKVLCKMLPPSGSSDGDHMHISNWLDLRDKAKQISNDVDPVVNYERRVSKLMDEEWVVQVKSLAAVPEFR